jgi:hypothetical protein
MTTSKNKQQNKMSSTQTSTNTKSQSHPPFKRRETHIEFHHYQLRIKYDPNRL